MQPQAWATSLGASLAVLKYFTGGEPVSSTCHLPGFGDRRERYRGHFGRFKQYRRKCLFRGCKVLSYKENFYKRVCDFHSFLRGEAVSGSIHQNPGHHYHQLDRACSCTSYPFRGKDFMAGQIIKDDLRGNASFLKSLAGAGQRPDAQRSPALASSVLPWLLACV